MYKGLRFVLTLSYQFIFIFIFLIKVTPKHTEQRPMYIYMLPKYPPPPSHLLFTKKKKNQSKFIISFSQLVISQE